MLLIAAEIDANGGKSVFLSRREIGRKAGVGANTVKISLEKLMKKHLVATSEPDYSPKAGGAFYTIPKEAYRALRTQSEPMTGERDPASEPKLHQASEATLVSSSSLKTTTNISSESSACRDIVARLDLDERFKISANDLLDAYHAVSLPIQQFIESVEHGSHYMECPSRKAGTVRNPKAFFISRLKSRYIEPEPDFVPFAVQQDLAKARASKMRVEQQKAAETERFEAEFAEYLSNSPDSVLKGVLGRTNGGKIHRDTPRSFGAIGELKVHFARETNRRHLVDNTTSNTAGSTDE